MYSRKGTNTMRQICCNDHSLHVHTRLPFLDLTELYLHMFLWCVALFGETLFVL